MPILRAQKESLVESLVGELEKSRVTLIVAYSNLNSQANDTLRSQAFKQGAKIKMISNNLLRLILTRLNKKIDIPQKSLALTYGFEDEIEAAKTLVDFSKETQALEILGGWIDGQFFDSSTVKTLATLPSVDVLYAQLTGKLKGLIGSMVYSLNYPLQKLTYVIKTLENQKNKL